jgi:hypothetical protein
LGRGAPSTHAASKPEGSAIPDTPTHEETAASLRAEAAELLEETGVRDLLATRFGDCSVVGSYALDLMSWRDLDLYMPVDPTELRRFVEALPLIHRAFAAHGRTVFRAVFNDEWARPRGDYGSGYYWGLRAAAEGGPVWKLDLWGWEPADYVRRLDALETLRHALAETDRSLLLRLKHQAQRLPGFRDTITSHDVYQFVMAGAGTTIEQLREFCAARRAGQGDSP